MLILASASKARLELLKSVGISPDKIISTESENVNQGRDYDSEISQIINDRTGPYWNSTHPDHAKVVQQVLTLREMQNAM